MKPQRKIFFLIWGLVCGVSLIIGGILALYLFEPLVKSIIVNTVPILPNSDVTKVWITPPIRPVLKIYYFNVTNSEVTKTFIVPHKTDSNLGQPTSHQHFHYIP